MKLRIAGRWLPLMIIGVGLGVGQSMAQTIGSLFQLMGGMDTVKKLSTNVLQSAAKDPRLAGVLGKTDTSAVAPKLADQMCSMLGGGCKAPLTDQQIAAGSSKLDASQTKALGDHFGAALNTVTGNPLVKEGVSKAIAPKLGGIVGALIEPAGHHGLARYAHPHVVVVDEVGYPTYGTEVLQPAFLHVAAKYPRDSIVRIAACRRQFRRLVA